MDCFWNNGNNGLNLWLEIVKVVPSRDQNWVFSEKTIYVWCIKFAESRFYIDFKNLKI